MAAMLDQVIVVGQFELQSRYIVCFSSNNIEKGMNQLISPAICWIAPRLCFYKDGFGIK